MKKVLFMLMAVALLAVSCEKEKEVEKESVDLSKSIAKTSWYSEVKEMISEEMATVKHTLSFVDDKNVTIEGVATGSKYSSTAKGKGTYTYDGKTQKGSFTMTQEGEEESMSGTFSITGDKMIVSVDGETRTFTLIKK